MSRALPPGPIIFRFGGAAPSVGSTTCSALRCDVVVGGDAGPPRIRVNFLGKGCFAAWSLLCSRRLRLRADATRRRHGAAAEQRLQRCVFAF